jgi:heavy metal sensor kinase
VIRLSLRLRLTLVFALAMAMMLGAIGALVYVRLQGALNHSLDQTLRAQLAEAIQHAGGAPRVESGELHDRDTTALIQLLRPDGTVVLHTLSASAPLLTAAQLRSVRADGRLEQSLGIHGYTGEWRLIATRQPGRNGLIAVAAGSEHSNDEALRNLLAELFVAGPLGLLVASLAAYFLAAAALRPVEAMRRRASQISTAQAGERLPVPGARDEIGRLGRTLNEMLGRIEAAVEHERRFVADASHELRTPLASLKTELELALNRPRSEEELRHALGSAAEETDRLIRISEGLLLLARSDQQELPVHLTRVAAGDLLEAVGARFAAQSTATGRRIEVDAPPGCEVEVDELRVEQALGNLVDNAFRHGAGTVSLTASVAGGLVELHVRDAGQGFPPDFLERAFHRFSRADKARSGGGAGLGLAIVELIADAHGGAAHAASPADGGADVWIAVPRSQKTHSQRSDRA